MNKTFFKTLVTISALSCFSLSLSACVTGSGSQSGGDLNSRVANLEEKVNTLNTQVDGTQSAEVWSRMQQMESDLSIVRNQMSDLDNRMSGPKGNQVMSANERLDRMEAALKEISARLGIQVEALEKPYTPATAQPRLLFQGGKPLLEKPYTPATAQPGEASSSEAPAPSYAAAPAENSASAPAPEDGTAQSSGTQIVNSDGTVTVLINGVPRRVPVNKDAVQAGSAPAEPQAAQAPASASNDVAKTLYDRGLGFFNKYQYNEALTCFKDFTANYPDNALTGNAWFWQGECSYQLQDYPGAIVAYQKVITAFSDNNKYPASLLKQGMALSANGNREQAKVRWKELVNRFPGTPEATRAKQLLAGKK